MGLNYPIFSNQSIKRVQNVLKSGKVNYWTGKECEKFEREFSKYVGNKYAITVSNGSVALEIALKTLNLKKGDNVIVTPGGKPIMFFAIMALIDRGDEVLYPNPGFPIYESMIEFCGGKAIPMRLYPEKDFGLNIDEIKSQINDNTKMIIINSPNNPCGSILSNKDLESLANLAKKHDLIVLSDEIYIRLLYQGKYESITMFPGMLDRTIILDGFSKTYAMTGWRLGYGLFPDNLVEPISRLITNSVSCTASFSQMAAIEAITGSQQASNNMVAEFKARRDLVVSGLNNIPGIHCPIPKGAFYAFPNIEQTGMTSSDFASKLLNETGVALLDGESFGKYGKGHVRISFANSRENLSEAIARIEKFVSK